MKQRLPYYSLLTLLLLFTACEKDIPVSQKIRDQLTEQGFDKANSVFNQLQDSTVTYNEAIAELNSSDLVEAIEGDSTRFAVKLKSGLVMHYGEPFPLDLDSLEQFMGKKPNENNNGNLCGKALVFNTAALDFDHFQSSLIIPKANFYSSKVKNLLEDNGMEVDYYNGRDATLGILENELAQYDLMYFVGHGDIYYNRTILLTGTFIDKKDLVWYIDDFYADLIHIWHKNDNQYYVAVTDKFFQEHYQNSAFPKIVYLAACQSITKTNLAEGIIDAGAEIVFGWQGYNSKGPKYGYKLLQHLVAGVPASTSFDILEDRFKSDYCEDCGNPAGNRPALMGWMSQTNDPNMDRTYLCRKHAGKSFLSLSNTATVNWDLNNLNDCFITDVSSYGSRYTIEFAAPQDLLNAGNDLFIELYGKFRNGYLDYDYGYSGENWIEISQNTGKIKLYFCTHFGNNNSTEVEMVIIASNDNYCSYPLKFTLTRPDGANKTASPFMGITTQ